MIGGTLAWLFDQTNTVTNTFTVGNVNIKLTEVNYADSSNPLDATDAAKEQSFKMIPGSTIAKKAEVTVLKGSEACYVYVKIVENDPSDVINWAIEEDYWTALDGVPGVYYHTQSDLSSSSVDATYSVFEGDKVTVSKDLRQSDTSNPTIAITAYAIQSANTGTAEQAWIAGGFDKSN
jgi:hypothetical protein